ncbi:MAG: hypothetical protein J0L75_08620 [Spirochaetes bacterium]|nr:hypothetical protein [Spirochaetota bacterium]
MKSLKDLVVIPDRGPIPAYLLKKDVQEAVLNEVFPEDNGIHAENRLLRVLGSLAKHILHQSRSGVILQEDLSKILGVSTTIRTQLDQLMTRLEKTGYGTTYRDPADNSVTTVWLHDKKAAAVQAAPETIDTAALEAKALELILQSAFSRSAPLFSKDEILRSLPPEPKIPFDIVEKTFVRLTASPDGLPVFWALTDRENRVLGYLARARLLHAFFVHVYDGERERLFESLVETALQNEERVSRLHVSEAQLSPEARWYIAKITEMLDRFPDRQSLRATVLALPFTDAKGAWEFLSDDELLDKAEKMVRAFSGGKQGAEAKASAFAQVFALSPERVAQEARRRGGGWLSRMVFKGYATRLAACSSPEAIAKVLASKAFFFLAKESVLSDYLDGLLAKRARELEARLRQPRVKSGPGVSPRPARNEVAPKKPEAPAAIGVPVDRVYRALGFLDYEKPASLEEVPAMLEAAKKSWKEHSVKPQKDRDAQVTEIQKKINVLKKVANPSEEAIRNFYNGLRSFYKNDKDLTMLLPVVKYLIIQALCG